MFVVDDEESIREGISLSLGKRYLIETYEDAESALAEYQTQRPDLVLLDIGLPHMDGIEALKKFREMEPQLPVIMITAYEDIQTVIAAMKLGAHDYVVKPIHMESLETTIKNAVETIRLQKEVRLLQEKYLRDNLPFFIGESNAIQDVMELIAMVSKSPDTPIIIIGETGTGKELIASAIHYRSPNFKGPFVAVNCAAITNNLIESELFGYEKGAFSGASAEGKRGLIEESEGGTLFLDEVGDLSLEAQAKLLRFLEEGEFYRVGGTKKISLHTRVVSATNKNISEIIKNGSFRKDLYYRLGVVRVEVPSLNERKDDIIPLAEYFMLVFSEKFEKPIKKLTRNAKTALLNHHRAGNVREIRNCIERGVLTCRSEDLEASDFCFEDVTALPSGPENGFDVDLPPVTMEGVDYPRIKYLFEKHYFDQALNITDGNESKAARLLGLNHHTFRYQKKKLDEF